MKSESQPYGSQVQRKFSCLPARFIGIHYHKVLRKEKCNRYSKKPYLSFFLQSYSVDQWWEWKDKGKMIYLPILSHNRFFYCRNMTKCLRLPETNPPLLKDIGKKEKKKGKKEQNINQHSNWIEVSGPHSYRNVFILAEVQLGIDSWVS